MAEHAVKDVPERRRFELVEAGDTAWADYRLDGETLIIPHVEAPAALRGTGAAGRLMEGVVTIARERGLKIMPVCSYAATWIRRHKEHSDLLA